LNTILSTSKFLGMIFTGSKLRCIDGLPRITCHIPFTCCASYSP
jgi:hypothetical protein